MEVHAVTFVLKTMGVDLVWFGIIMVILLEAALVSPPEGLNLYIIQGIRKSVSEEAGLKAGDHARPWIGVLHRALAAEPRHGEVRPQAGSR